MPPKSLIASNYQSAEIVVTVRITKKEIDKTISADDGTPGYLVTKESGIILESFKGTYEAGDEIVFHDWLEYDANWQTWRPDTALVFLRVDEDTKRLKTIAEGAVFDFDPKLVEILKEAMDERDLGAKSSQPTLKQSPIKTQQK